MDPVTQGALGAVFAQSSASKQQLFKAALVGAIGGMVPDLDVLIRSAEDPLLFLEYHRHFTHSLFFIPIGGVLCGVLLYGLFGKLLDMSLKQMLLWSTIGYATHALLDACTSYGTLLLWPLSDRRFSWDTISVVDPLVTVPLLFLIVRAASAKAKTYVWIAIAWVLFYLSLGYLQHERAINMGRELAVSRNHTVIRLEAKPSFANILVWKVIYESNGMFYVDAVKPGLFSSTGWQGEKIAKLDLERDFPWLDPDSQQARDIQRFDYFSAGFTAVDPQNKNRIIDMRYSMLPQEIQALWGIELSRDAGPREHVEYYTERNNGREAFGRLWSMIWN
ncbi:MAG: metal-dependent hydrolase [Cellvibrionaceae bacterium]